MRFPVNAAECFLVFSVLIIIQACLLYNNLSILIKLNNALDFKYGYNNV